MTVGTVEEGIGGRIMDPFTFGRFGESGKNLCKLCDNDSRTKRKVTRFLSNYFGLTKKLYGTGLHLKDPGFYRTLKEMLQYKFHQRLKEDVVMEDQATRYCRYIIRTHFDNIESHCCSLIVKSANFQKEV